MRMTQRLPHRTKKTEKQISDHELGANCQLCQVERFHRRRQNNTVALPRGPEPITAEHNVAGCSLQMHFNAISSDDPEARCHWLLNNGLEASSGHCGNYLYVRPLKDMSTHGTSRQPAP